MGGPISNTGGNLQIFQAAGIDPVTAPPLPPEPEPIEIQAPPIPQDQSEIVTPDAPATVEIATVPPPPPDPDPPGKVTHHFASWGDPHDIDEAGHKFNDEGTGKKVEGTETYLQSKSGDFQLQGRRKHVEGKKKTVLYNTAAAIQSNGNIIKFNVRAEHELHINGKAVNLSDPTTFPPGATPIPGGLKLPDGTSVTKNGATTTVTTPKGDTVNIEDKSDHIDIRGSSNRDMYGVLGDLGNKGLTPEQRMAKYRVAAGDTLFDAKPTGSGGTALNTDAQLAALDMLLGLGK